MKHIILCVVVFALAGCCTLKGDVRKVIEDSIAINAGVMGKENVPQSTKTLATKNHDNLWSVLYRSGCIDELPADVRKRKQERDAAKAAAAGGGQ